MATVTGSCHCSPGLNSFSRTITVAALILFLCSWPSTALAQEILLGTVISIDRDKGIFVLRLDNSKGEAPPLVTIHSGVSDNEAFLPDCVEVGGSVRVWGQYDGESTGSFRANVVRGPGLGQYDRSGVRSRLNRGQGSHQPGRQSGRSRNRR